MHYLIDTYNAVHAATGMGGVLGNMTVRKLCQFLAASAVHAGRVTLVLDGRAKPDEPGENEFPDITLVYSGVGVSADAVIGQMVERSGQRRKLMVVTNDRAVALAARRLFAGAMSCETFLAQLVGISGGVRVPEAKRVDGGSPGEVEHWMKEFGLKGEVPGFEGRGVSTGSAEDELGGMNIEDLLGPPG